MILLIIALMLCCCSILSLIIYLVIIGKVTEPSLEETEKKKENFTLINKHRGNINHKKQKYYKYNERF